MLKSLPSPPRIMYTFSAPLLDLKINPSYFAHLLTSLSPPGFKKSTHPILHTFSLFCPLLDLKINPPYFAHLLSSLSPPGFENQSTLFCTPTVPLICPLLVLKINPSYFAHLLPSLSPPGFENQPTLFCTPSPFFVPSWILILRWRQFLHHRLKSIKTHTK